jgi:hypothetical protein
MSVTALAAGACTRHDGRFLYHWDDARVLCSRSVDDWDRPPDIDDLIATARATSSVALVHTHTAGLTISWQRLIDLVDSGLPLVTYPELVPTAAPHAALALAFDDDAIDAWYGMRELFDAHHVRVTFFVTRFAHLDAVARSKLAELAADGHAIEAHGVEHVAIDREPALADDAYVESEALPSIDVLRAAGYRVTTFAYPGGHSRPRATELVLGHVARVRVGPHGCPH